MRRGVIRGLGEPASQGLPVGDAVAARDPALVDGAEGVEKRWDGFAGLSTQDLGLGNAAGATKKPSPKADSTADPTAAFLRFEGFCRVEHVGEGSLGNLAQNSFHVANLGETFGDFTGGQDEFAEKSFQVFDEHFLVVEELRGGHALEIDCALKIPHEGLCARGQFFEAIEETAELGVELAHVERGWFGEFADPLERIDQIPEGGGLQLAGSLDEFEEKVESALGRLAFRGELVEETGPVESLHGGDIGGVSRGGEISPLVELGKAVRQLLLLERIVPRRAQSLADIGRSEMDFEVLASRREDPEDGSVEGAFSAERWAKAENVGGGSAGI